MGIQVDYDCLDFLAAQVSAMLTIEPALEQERGNPTVHAELPPLPSGSVG